MKVLFSAVAILLCSNLAFSQVQSKGTVTINVTGNRTKQIIVDNQTYSINNTTTTQKQEVVITTLQNGQHPLEIVRLNNYNRTATTKTSFTLREGYDLTLAISQNGSVSSTEKRIVNNGGAGIKRPITTAVFNKLYAAAKAKTTSASRTSYLETEFATNKMYTSSQASKLIQLVNSESLRLKLAKQVYTHITDKQNFSSVVNLLNSTANRTELNEYTTLSDADNEDGDDDEEVGIVPITNERFNTIYSEVSAENIINDRYYYLSNFFSKDYNYYTSAQVSQLIQLTTVETERFNLAKSAYRGVIDRENYSQVYQLLRSSSNRADLLTYINSYNNANVRTGMTTDEFNKIYQTASYQNSTTGRFNFINTSLTTAGNYFTASQAKQLIQLVNSESSRLALSKTAYKVLVDRANHALLSDLLNSTASKNDFNNYVSTFDSINNTGAGIVMSDVEYNKLLKSVSDSWSPTTRFKIVSEAFQSGTNFFTVYQVGQLLALINGENDRFNMAKSAYDNIVDRNNFSQLYDLFPTASTRDALAKFAGDMDNGGTVVVKTPMSDADYNSLLRNMQFTFGIGAKMTALTNLFNDETKYFTVVQAKRLIEMVSLEANRLELAKLSYNNITDPASFPEVYDLLNSQASKDELADYVRKNSYN